MALLLILKLVVEIGENSAGFVVVVVDDAAEQWTDAQTRGIGDELESALATEASCSGWRAGHFLLRWDHFLLPACHAFCTSVVLLESLVLHQLVSLDLNIILISNFV